MSRQPSLSFFFICTAKYGGWILAFCRKYLIPFGDLRWLINIWFIYTCSKFKRKIIVWPCERPSTLCFVLLRQSHKQHISCSFHVNTTPASILQNKKTLAKTILIFSSFPSYRCMPMQWNFQPFALFLTNEITELITGSWDQTTKKTIPNLQSF